MRPEGKGARKALRMAEIRKNCLVRVGFVEENRVTLFHRKKGKFHVDGVLCTGSAFAWLPRMATGVAALAIADPPYNMGREDWDRLGPEHLAFTRAWLAEVARILAPDGTVYIFGLPESAGLLASAAAGLFTGFRQLCWTYRNKASLGLDWGRSHDIVLHFRKNGETRLNVDDVREPYSAHTLKYPVRAQGESSRYGNGKRVWSPNPLGAKPRDVIDIPAVCNGMAERTGHPTQKPEELVRKLVLASSAPGDIVLDPFAGSGTVAVCCAQLGRRFAAVEQNPEYMAMAQERLGNLEDISAADYMARDRETAQRRKSIR